MDNLKRIYRRAVVYAFLPVLINGALCRYLYLYKDESEFIGYFLGTVLGVLFLLTWILIIRKVPLANPMVLFILTLGSFPVKLIGFALFAFGGLRFFQMDPFFFGIALIAGIIPGLFIEIWFILAVNRAHKLSHNSRGTVEMP
jgi:hypothetical protein